MKGPNYCGIFAELLCMNGQRKSRGRACEEHHARKPPSRVHRAPARGDGCRRSDAKRLRRDCNRHQCDACADCDECVESARRERGCLLQEILRSDRVEGERCGGDAGLGARLMTI